MLQPPPSSTLFPYTTLFRSQLHARRAVRPLRPAAIDAAVVLPVTQRGEAGLRTARRDRKSTRLNSSHTVISYAVFCLKKKKDALDDFNGVVTPDYVLALIYT